MKAKVNPKTGMVAIVAGKGVSNKSEGSVFGALPKDAAYFLSRKFVTLFNALPSESKTWPEVDLNVEQGVAGKVSESIDPPSGGDNGKVSEQPDPKPQNRGTHQ